LPQSLERKPLNRGLDGQPLRPGVLGAEGGLEVRRDPRRKPVLLYQPRRLRLTDTEAVDVFQIHHRRPGPGLLEELARRSLLRRLARLEAPGHRLPEAAPLRTALEHQRLQPLR